jgi:hypothetical protein
VTRENHPAFFSTPAETPNSYVGSSEISDRTEARSAFALSRGTTPSIVTVRFSMPRQTSDTTIVTLTASSLHLKT